MRPPFESGISDIITTEIVQIPAWEENFRNWQEIN
jgi:hypothetical protein